MSFLLLAVLAVLLVFLIKKRQYEKTEYYRQTKNSYLKVRFDKGLLGEFCTYRVDFWDRISAILDADSVGRERTITKKAVL